MDDFINKACDPEWLPPGAAMELFVHMCTGLPVMYGFRGELGMKMKQLFTVWNEAHPWAKANILYGMRSHLYEEHHLVFCEAQAAKAQQYDKMVEEARMAAKEDAETSSLEGGDDESIESNKDD